jgi:hypothetical protein
VKQVLIFLLMTITATMQAQQTNYHFSHTDSTTATGDKIWQVWTDVPNWKQWDKGLKEAVLNGPFMVGSKGKLIPDKGPKSKFVITEVDAYQSYTFKTRIPFGWLIIKRSLSTNNGITYFTHDVQFTGLLKKIFGKQLGKNYRAMLPKVMAEIKKIAEQK